MLKKILIAFAVIFSVGTARAELKVDIVAGAASPIPVAVQKFEVIGNASKKDAA